MSPSSSFLLLAKTITHPAARSLCDSWVSCFILLWSNVCSLYFLANTMFVSFAVVVLISTLKPPVQSPLLSFILNVTTATHCAIIFHSLRKKTPEHSELVTTHVLRLWSLLFVHLPGPLWKSLIALLDMLHLVYGTNSPLISASLVRYSLLHFHLSHMAVHHLHHIHYHRLHLLLLAQCFILNSWLGSSANPFLHRHFLLIPDWLHLFKV